MEDRQRAAPVIAPAAGRRRGIWIAVVFVLLAALAVGYVAADREWPFTRSSVIEALQQQSGSNVQVQTFRQMYFPTPGCVAEGVSFRRGNSGQPFLTIQKLTITSNYPALLAHHISNIKADGLHVTIAEQPESSAAETSQGFNIGTFSSGVTIGQNCCRRSGHRIRTHRRSQASTHLLDPKLTLHDLGAGKPLAFQATVQIPQPPAEVDVKGTFGAWQAGHGGESELSGYVCPADRRCCATRAKASALPPAD